jgi:hypothetical protein
MKKIVFLLFLANIIVSCNSNDELDKTNLDKDFIPASSYGYYHNALLDYSLNGMKSKNPTDILDMYDELKNTSNILFPDMLSENEYLFYRNRMGTILDNNNEQKNSFNLIEFAILSINTFLSNEASNQLVSLLENNEGPQEVNQVFTNLLNSETLTETEKNEILKMKNVYNSSVGFWNNENNKNYFNKEMECDPQDQIFLSDAVGCLFGGLGAVGFSWFCYEAQSQNGGGCI